MFFFVVVLVIKLMGIIYKIVINKLLINMVDKYLIFNILVYILRLNLLEV